MAELKKVRIGLDVDEITPYTAGDNTVIINPTTKKITVNTDVIPTREDIPAGGGVCLEEITWAALKAKRDAGTLDKGRQYRITDYVCTTTQQESRAVSHPFDVIVFADDESTLNENARACLHDTGEPGVAVAYDGTLAVGEAEPGASYISTVVDMTFGSLPSSITVTYDGTEYSLPADKYANVVLGYGEWGGNGPSFETWPIYVNIDGGEAIYTPVGATGTHTLKIEYTDTGYYGSCNLEAWELKYCIDNDTDRFSWADTENGNGVIYYMKDDYNNECPYDFKQIQFARYVVTSDENDRLTGAFVPLSVVPPSIAVSETPTWFYTFSIFDSGAGGSYKDASLTGHAIGNVIKPSYLVNGSDGGGGGEDDS